MIVSQSKLTGWWLTSKGMHCESEIKSNYKLKNNVNELGTNGKGLSP